MVNASLGSIIERLDALDGISDGRYTDLALHIQNSTGVCELAETYAEQASDLGLPVRTSAVLTNLDGVRVPVDCDILVRRLNSLIGIAQRLPAFKFIADVSAGTPLNELEAPTREDLYGYHIVDHMITSFLLGIATTGQSLSEIFGLIPYDVYTESVERMAGMIPNMAPGELDIGTADQAYDLFERLGERYGFNVSSFEPAGHER